MTLCTYVCGAWLEWRAGPSPFAREVAHAGFVGQVDWEEDGVGLAQRLVDGLGGAQSFASDSVQLRLRWQPRATRGQP